MIIEHLTIKKLHGEYNYSLSLNEDLTFLYGSNGCGKTTILNIISSIITGKIYRLNELSFSSISLLVKDPKTSTTEEIILSLKKFEESKTLKIQLKNANQEIIIDNFDTLNEKMIRNMENDDLDSYFEQSYPQIKEIKKLFNYVYLPLNRLTSMDSLPDYEVSPFRRRRYIRDTNSYLNNSLEIIKRFVQDSCMKINIEENNINNEFRKKILQSATRVSKENSIDKLLVDSEKLNVKQVEKAKTDYINTLKDLDVINDEFSQKIEQFFDDFLKEIIEREKSDNKETYRLQYIFLFSDYLRIQQVVKFAQENEKKKVLNRHDKDLFQDTINKFLNTSSMDKRMEVSKDGTINFYCKDRQIQLPDLSSGEKQIIITFASFIFGFQNVSDSIYIVDEPESSLHLEWQSMFIQSLLNTKKNVQLIFATHSPDLIGEFRNKAIKVIRE